jgi:hypothetical protein
MFRLGLGAILILMGSSACADEMAYAIYSIPLFGGGAELVAEGRRHYAHDEVKVVSGPAPNLTKWTKTLAIANGFELGASVYREPRVDGFGLWIRKNGEGFSWEWFKRESEDVFRKLQGAGRLKVRFKHTGALEEVAEIEFLSDVTMRLNMLWLIPFLHEDTDQLIVKKGSVLWLSP